MMNLNDARLMQAVAGLLLAGCMALTACGGGSGSNGVEALDSSNGGAAEAVAGTGFDLAGPVELMELATPPRGVSSVRDASDYDPGLPSNQVEVSGSDPTNLVFLPQWDPGNDPPLTELALCMYTFNVLDYSGPGSASLVWQLSPFYPSNVFIGLGNRDEDSWDWFRCDASYLVELESVDPYTTPEGDVLLAVVMTNIFDATLASVNFNAGDNEAPVADLVIAAGGGSTGGPVALDASGSTDSDGTIVSYEWDYNGDGSWDESTTEAVNNHTFATTGRRDVAVRVTDNGGESDSASVNIGVYDEYESNDDGTYNATDATNDDIAAANTLPVVDFSGYSGNCGAGGYGDDREDYFVVNIPETGWYSFTSYHKYSDADIDMRLYEDIGGSYAELRSATTTSDNDSFTYEFTSTGEFYWKIYAHTAAANADYTLELVQGLVPTASFTATPTDGDIPLDVIYDASASSDTDGSITLYEWDFDGDGNYDESSATATTSHQFTAPGTYTTTLRVTDDDGLTGTATRTIRAIGQPPVADLVADVTSGTAPLRVNLDASDSTDPEGDIVGYRFDLDGNSTYEYDNGDSPYLTHDFIHGGTITVSVQVTDASGSNDTDSVDITCGNSPPTAVLSALPTSGSTPLDVTFDASASTDPNDDIIAYHWDWDSDGTYDDTSEDPTFDFTFFYEGNYTVTVQVEDGAGQTDTDTATVNVTADYAETEVNDSYQTADELPALDFTGWNGAVGPKTGITADPEDWSQFTIPSAGNVSIYMTLYDDWGDIDVALFDSDGTTELEDSIETDDDELIEWHFAAGGTYYIQVYMFTSGDEPRGGYDLEVSFTAD